MFGTRWLTMLFGFAFFSHQVGGFLGVWLGGLVFESDRLLRPGVVAVGVLRRRLRDHQSADRREAGGAAGRRPRHNRPAMTRLRRDRLAHTARHPGLRVPDRADQLRAALDLRVFPHADDGRQRLGPRRVRAGARDRDAAVGRRHSRSPARSPTASARSWVLVGGALLYVAGIVWMAYAASPARTASLGRRADRLRARRLLVHAGDRRLRQDCCPSEWRTIAFGAGTAAGSFGQFLFSPLAVALIDHVGWQNALLIFGAIAAG